MRKIFVNTSSPYDILIERGILSDCGKIIRSLTNALKAVIITDSNVASIYGDEVFNNLSKNGFDTSIFTFKAGEESKTLHTISEIYEHLAEHNITRSDIIIALGGGVTGDISGFAAATWQRGIDFIQIPTSLLAQIDSSVGGKTAVDLKSGKNLVGAFHQPKLVLIDPNVLSTLPDEYFRDGMGEVIKYGCIKSPSLFEKLEKFDILEIIEDVIFECVDIKKNVVQSDEFDKGERMILNFGHTFGHAIEKKLNFNGISHGMAVGIGMLIAVYAGEINNITSLGCYEKIENLLKKYGMPTKSDIPLSELCDLTCMDKKKLGNDINLILLNEIGKCGIYPVNQESLYQFCKGD